MGLLTLNAQTTLDFEAEPFVDGTDFESNIYESGNFRITHSFGNFIEETNGGEMGSQSLRTQSTNEDSTLTIESIDGAEFQFVSFYNSLSQIRIITGFRDGNPVAIQRDGFPPPGSPGQTLTLSSDFENIDRVVLNLTASGGPLDTLVFDPPVSGGSTKNIVDFDLETFSGFETDLGFATYTSGNYRFIASDNNFGGFDQGEADTPCLVVNNDPNGILTIETVDGTEVKFESFFVSRGDDPYTIEGFRNGASTGTETLTPSLGGSREVFVLGSALDNVDRAVLTFDVAGGFEVIDTFEFDTNTQVLSTTDFNVHENSITLSPNPSVDFIQVSGLLGDASYRIYNLLGAEIKSGVVSNQEDIDIRDFANGLYLLQLDTGNTLKFLKE